MHKLHTNGGAIGAAQNINDLADCALFDPQHVIEENQAIKISFSESIRGRVKLRMEGWLFETQRIDHHVVRIARRRPGKVRGPFVQATADEVAQLLKDKNLENPNAMQGTRKLCDDLDHFYVTDAAERFGRVAERFLGTKPSKLEAIEVYGVDELRKN